MLGIDPPPPKHFSFLRHWWFDFDDIETVDGNNNYFYRRYIDQR